MSGWPQAWRIAALLLAAAAVYLVFFLAGLALAGAIYRLGILTPAPPTWPSSAQAG